MNQLQAVAMNEVIAGKKLFSEKGQGLRENSWFLGQSASERLFGAAGRSGSKDRRS